MFAGKTTALLEIASHLKQEEYLVFKSNIDTRSKPNTILTHKNQTISCIDLAEPTEIIRHLHSNTKFVLIDEVQFLDSSIIPVLSKLLLNNIAVVCAGLLYDARQEFFGSTKAVLNMANQKTELFAECNHCGNAASVTRYLGNLDTQITIGGTERYLALCSSCHRLNAVH